MALNNGLGRPKISSKYSNINDYLKKYLFPIKDLFFDFKKEEAKKLKAYNIAKGKRNIQEQKLQRAYEGLENFRK